MALGDILSSLGSGLGSAGRSVGQFLTGKPGEVKQLPTLRPEQQQLQNQVIQQVLALLQGGQGTRGFDFGPIAQQARTNFATETIPGLAERFTSLGGGQRSSAFQGALGSAASGLEQSLAALQSQIGLQQQGQQQNLLTNLLGLGLKSPFENIYQQGTQGALPGIAQGLISLLPYLIAL